MFFYPVFILWIFSPWEYPLVVLKSHTLIFQQICAGNDNPSISSSFINRDWETWVLRMSEDIYWVTDRCPHSGNTVQENNAKLSEHGYEDFFYSFKLFCVVAKVWKLNLKPESVSWGAYYDTKQWVSWVFSKEGRGRNSDPPWGEQEGGAGHCSQGCV